jgi:hypothetical protein
MELAACGFESLDFGALAGEKPRDHFFDRYPARQTVAQDGDQPGLRIYVAPAGDQTEGFPSCCGNRDMIDSNAVTREFKDRVFVENTAPLPKVTCTDDLAGCFSSALCAVDRFDDCFRRVSLGSR